ncbi:tRNA (guanosine(46)-N7)-methyltransferase TrmB [Mycoplasmopsis phocirhinis]|uniref:tRNA (guanine-N(7)-)-methyltransferase n=1 Tax=Mycoplasmopsis phocirhinis TaxID=142650 RepID=A0A4P6MPJ9_9BACT|nr:tRNA (guanosine(46)-N7)-methyltransferase TrmB [Mycoplasmopsis phocirhinis]QBF34666.1 tRNA (guanosine(46)-N7)-methyltransferase TrmB [Mycoplasmopsis phocirhinis]
MRLRHDKNAIAKLNESEFLIHDEQFPIYIDDKCVIEIGMGKGEMLVELARLNPDKKYFGLEKYPTVAAKSLKLAQHYKLDNFKIIIADANSLTDIFQGYAHTIWLTFSDPWPKARHFRRRLTHQYFLNLYLQIMNEKSVLKFKSDNDSLYQFSLESFLQNHWNIIEHGTNLHNTAYAKENIMTGYERKWSQQGKNINFIFATKPIEFNV